MILRDAQMIMVEMMFEIDKICKKHNIEYYLSDGTLLGAIRHKGFIPWDDDLDISMTRDNYKKFEKVAQGELGSKYFVQTIDTEKTYGVNGCPMKIRHNNSLFKEKGRDKVNYNEGIFIDVFPMDRVPKSKLITKLQRVIGQGLIQVKEETNKTNPIKKFIEFILKPINYRYFQRLIRSTIWINEKFGTDKYTYGVDTYFYNQFIYDEKNLFPLKEAEFEGYKFSIPNNPDIILKNLYGDYMRIPSVEERHTHATHIEIYEENNNGREILI